MIIYFNIDIFRNTPTGLFRYAYQIQKGLKGKFDVRPISFSKAIPSEEFLKFLKQEFEHDLAQDTRFFWSEKNTNNNFFRKRFLLKKKSGINGKVDKLVLELFRFLIRIEKIFDRFLITNIKKNSVIFSPFEPVPKIYCNRGFLIAQTVHDIIPLVMKEFYNESDRKHFMPIMKSSFNADIVFFNSDYTKKDYLEYFKINDSPRYIVTKLATSDGIKHIDCNEELIRVRKKYNIPLENDYIISVSTSEPRKNRAKIIEAWTKVKELDTNVSANLVFTGSILNHDNIFQKLPEAIKSSIFFIGFVDDEDLGALYSGSVFSIFLSLYEGFGLPVLESMTCHRFCLTANTTSLPEIIGENLPTVNPLCVESTTKLLLRILNDKALLDSYHKTAYRNSLNFSWEETVSQTSRALKEFASKK